MYPHPICGWLARMTDEKGEYRLVHIKPTGERSFFANGYVVKDLSPMTVTRGYTWQQNRFINKDGELTDSQENCFAYPQKSPYKSHIVCSYGSEVLAKFFEFDENDMGIIVLSPDGSTKMIRIPDFIENDLSGTGVCFAADSLSYIVWADRKFAIVDI